MVDAGITTDASNWQPSNLVKVGFNTLPEAVAYLVDQVRPLDKNGNGFVCAYRLPGTRTGWGDPNFAHYRFGVSEIGNPRAVLVPGLLVPAACTLIVVDPLVPNTDPIKTLVFAGLDWALLY